MAILGIPMLLGPIFGPILGGCDDRLASWHWIFLINLPIGIASLVYALGGAAASDNVQPSESFDFVGMLLLSPGLAAFLFGVTLDPRGGHRDGPDGDDPGGRCGHPARRLRALGAGPRATSTRSSSCAC